MKGFCKSIISAITVAAIAVVLSASQARAAITVDGTADGDYGSALAVQNTQTGFGDSNLGQVGFANGSELDQGFGVIQGGTLYLTLAGNLESNFNKLEIFLDTGAGGQNQLRGDNAGVDFNGLNRMGNDGSGNGLKFDTAFTASHWIGVTVGGGTPTIFANYAVLLPAGGGPGFFLGSATPGGSAVLSGGDVGAPAVQLQLNNINVAGVTGGSGADSGAGVTTGIELAISLADLGNPTGPIKVSAFINGSGHDFLSNQVLGGIGGGGNLGEPRTADFSAIAGDQFFTVVPEPSTIGLVITGLLGALAIRRRKV